MRSPFQPMMLVMLSLDLQNIDLKTAGVKIERHPGPPEQLLWRSGCRRFLRSFIEVCMSLCSVFVPARLLDR